MEDNKTKWAVRIISIVIAVTALALIGALAFFWQQERATTRALRDRLSEAGVSAATDGKKPSTPTSKLCDTATTRYTAAVGRFSVTIEDSSYVIIKNHEGPGEGGNSSRISIGKCLDAANNVISFGIQDEVWLTAVPSSQWAGTTFDQWIRGQLEAGGSPSTELERSTIDGVSARNFRADGLFERRLTFFEREGIWYMLEAANAESDSTASMQARAALINGFAFN